VTNKNELICGKKELRHLLTLSTLSALLSVAFGGLEVLYTLYALNELKINASDWSQIRAYRYIATIVFIVVLGTYASKVGQRKISALAVACSVVNLTLFLLYPTKFLLFIMVPMHSASVSLVLMNINVLAQEVPARLQATSNTVYRSIYTGMAFFGPLLIALSGNGMHQTLFVCFTALLLFCFIGFLHFPHTVEKEAGGEVIPSLRDLVRSWGVLLRNRRFVLFQLLITLIYSAFIVNVIFGPIKLIKSFGMTDQQFGYTSTGVAVVTMIGILCTGAMFAKSLKGMIYWPLLLCSLSNILLGLQSSIVISILLFIAANAFHALSLASVSMWITRMVPDHQLSLAFAFHKVFLGLFGFIFSIFLSILESPLGIDRCLVLMGLVGCVLSLLLKRELDIQSSKTSILAKGFMG
jgi:MFS family permease